MTCTSASGSPAGSACPYISVSGSQAPLVTSASATARAIGSRERRQNTMTPITRCVSTTSKLSEERYPAYPFTVQPKSWMERSSTPWTRRWNSCGVPLTTRATMVSVINSHSKRPRLSAGRAGELGGFSAAFCMSLACGFTDGLSVTRAGLQGLQVQPYRGELRIGHLAHQLIRHEFRVQVGAARPLAGTQRMAELRLRPVGQVAGAGQVA